MSFGIGLVLVFALYPLFRDIDSHPKRLYLLFAGMAVLGAAYLLFAELWPFPADVDAANLASGRKNAYHAARRGAGHDVCLLARPEVCAL